MLYQVQDGKERVMACTNRSLLPTEKNDQNFSSFKLNWAVTEKVKGYLWEATFTVFTNHNFLVHLHTANLGPTGKTRCERWGAILVEKVSEQ